MDPPTHFRIFLGILDFFYFLKTPYASECWFWGVDWLPIMLECTLSIRWPTNHYHVKTAHGYWSDPIHNTDRYITVLRSFMIKHGTELWQCAYSFGIRSPHPVINCGCLVIHIIARSRNRPITHSSGQLQPHPAQQHSYLSLSDNGNQSDNNYTTLSHSRSGGGSPPQSIPGSSRGVAGR